MTTAVTPYLTDDFQTFIAERVRVESRHCLPLKEMQAVNAAVVTSYIDHAINALHITLTAGIAAMPKERIQIHRRWPKTWWDAFKRRWYPQWATKRWPVEYEEINIDKKIYGNVCPHLQCDPQHRHLKWMAQNDSKNNN